MSKRKIHNWAYHRKSESIEDDLPRCATVLFNIFLFIISVLIFGSIAWFIISEIILRFL